MASRVSGAVHTAPHTTRRPKTNTMLVQLSAVTLNSSAVDELVALRARICATCGSASSLLPKARLFQ